LACQTTKKINQRQVALKTWEKAKKFCGKIATKNHAVPSGKASFFDQIFTKKLRSHA
jgi:hypothetical protein